MINKECQFYSEEKCIAADLTLCDFEKDDYKQCLRYKLYFLKPQMVQLR